MPELTVVMMAYNEVNTLARVVSEHARTLGQLGISHEILIVDDGSSDGTSRVADSLAASAANIRVMHHDTNRGLGGVYRTGFSEATGDFLTFFPADGQFPASIVGRFWPLMAGYDMVLGYLPDRQGPLAGKLLSGLERVLYRCLFGYLPRFQGVLMFRRAILDRLELRSAGRGWAVLMELIIRTVRAGYRVTSVATTMRARTDGESKVNNIRSIRANLAQVFALRGYL